MLVLEAPRDNHILKQIYTCSEIESQNHFGVLTTGLYIMVDHTQYVIIVIHMCVAVLMLEYLETSSFVMRNFKKTRRYHVAI